MILKITKNVCGSLSDNPHAPELPRSYRLKFPPLHRSENEQSDTVWKTQSVMLKSLPEFQAFYHYIKVRWMQQIRSWNARTERNNPLGFFMSRAICVSSQQGLSLAIRFFRIRFPMINVIAMDITIWIPILRYFFGIQSARPSTIQKIPAFPIVESPVMIWSRTG